MEHHNKKERVEGWRPDAMRVYQVLEDVSIEDIAEAVGVSSSTVYAWQNMRNTTPPPVEYAEIVARLLRCTVKELCKRPVLDRRDNDSVTLSNIMDTVKETQGR